MAKHQKAVESSHRAPGALSIRKRRTYLAVTLLLPWVILGLLEVALRIAGYGNSYPLFIAYRDRPEYLMPNPEVAKRYFGDGPFVPTPQVDFFHKRRTPRTFRIVFQGESSAIGFPYLHGAAPSRMIEQRLQTASPDRDIEVVNTALTAVNSYTLLDFANEIIATQPDAVMIYTGHNEFYGVFGAGSARSVASNPRLVRAYLTLRRLRAVQLLSNAIAKGRPAAPAPGRPDEARSVMELMAGEQRIPVGSPTYNEGLEQFRSNIGDLLAKYRDRGIPVFIGTVASNERDQRPFIGVGAESLYNQAKTADARGDYASAAKLYRAAKDQDELRFRAPEAINRIIRKEAARHGAYVVETQQALERASPQGIIGHQLMLEHLHPNIDGYFVIAEAFLKAMKDRHMLDGSNKTAEADARKAVLVTAVDSLTGLYHADRLTSGWPFQPKGKELVPIVDTLRPHNLEEQLAQGMVVNRVSWPEAMTRLREAYEKAGDLGRAVHVALTMAQEYRYSAQPYLDAARIEIGRKQYDAALRYTVAAARREEKPETVQLAGLLLLRNGDQALAIKYLERSVQLAPHERPLGVALRAAKVIPELESNRAQAPRDTTVLYTLAGAYALTQQYEKARELLDALFTISPGHAAGKQLLQRMPPPQ
ncbi:MAG TPA: hypothetical protein VHM24_01325 [Gemmatimonadaceae bacterium]|nr:hypothetical protein [Gemmatimonadaceae bacterium]